MAKIKIKKQNRGKFTSWAQSHGMSVQEAARYILAHRTKFSPTLIRRANFARNAAKWEEGGVYQPFTYAQAFAGGGMSKGQIAAARKKPGGSNVGKKTFANGQKRTGPYVGPSGGAPKGSYPIPDLKHARAALALAHNAPNPSGIKAAVKRKYPQLAADGGEIVEYSKGGIHINPANKGKFTATKKKTGKTTEQLTHSKNPLTRKRAIFAQNARKWHHKGRHQEGGPIGKPTPNKTNPNWWPQTDFNVATGLGITPKEFLAMPETDRMKFVNESGKYVALKSGATANKGRVQYFEPRQLKAKTKPKITTAPNYETGQGYVYDETTGTNIPIAEDKFSRAKYKSGGQVSNKIKLLMNEGYPQKQAVAIALDMQRRHKLAEGGFLSNLSGALGAINPILGAVGGVLNIFGQRQQQKEEARQAELARVQQVDQAQNAAQANLYNPYAATFAAGGQFKGKLFSNRYGAGNSLVQDGEIILNPNGRVEQASNPSSPNADNISANFATGTKIISRKNSIPYLQDVKKLNKANKLKFGGVTNITKNTLNRNINKYYSRMLDAYNVQEVKKAFQGGGSRMDVPVPINPYGYGLGPALHQGLMDRIPPTNTLAEMPNYESTKYTASPGTLPNFWDTAKNIGTSIGEMAPTLYNLGQGLFGRREQLNPRDYYNPYEGRINDLMANRRYNIEAPLASNLAGYRTAAANIRNLGGSRGQIYSNLTGAQNAKMYADMSAYESASNANNAYAGEYANTLYGLGRDRSTTDMTIADLNAANRAAGRNYFSAAATGLQNYFLNKEQMANQAARDKLLGNAIQGYSPYANKWITGLAPWLAQNAS